MRNPEKSALRKQFRRARAQMSADERNAATETINRLLKPHIKKDGKSACIGRWARNCDWTTLSVPHKNAAQNSTCPISNRTRGGCGSPPTLPTAPNKNANAAALNCMSPNSPAKNPRPPTQPIAGPHRRHRQTRLPPRTSRRLLRRHPLRHEIPLASPNPGRRLRLPIDRHPADRTPRHPPKRLCLRAWHIEIQKTSIE